MHLLCSVLVATPRHQQFMENAKHYGWHFVYTGAKLVPKSCVGGLLVSLSTLKVTVGYEIAVPGLALRFERRI